MRHEFGIGKDVFLLGCVGRLVPIKNVGILIEIMADLTKNRPDIALLIVGDGAERPALQELARALRIADHIFFAGMRRDIFRLMTAVDLYVHPSKEESFGYAVAEAMATGKAVVAFHTGSLSEIVDDGVTGKLVPLNDRGAMAKAIEDFCANPKMSWQFGEVAAERIAKHFTVQAMTKQIAEIYRLVPKRGQHSQVAR
jgi:glycosyltransferase involved in cell wall biosynthesis